MTAGTPRRGRQGPNAENYSYPRPDPPRPIPEPVEVPAAQPVAEPDIHTVAGGRILPPWLAEAPASTELRGPGRRPDEPRTEQGVHFRTSAGGPPSPATEPTAVGLPPRSTSN